MVKLTADPHQLTMSSAQIQDIYSGLEQDIFKAFVDRLKTKGLTGDNVQQWQMQKLNELHLVNKDTIKLVSEASGQSEKQLNKLFIDGGVAIYNDEIANIDSGISGKVVENNQIDQVLEGYLNQTRLDLDNNVNQTLLTTNFGDSPVAKTYQQIIKETTADVLSGLKTPDRALADTIYKWRNQGITPVMIDKGGHQWSLEGYARTVIDTTSTRAFQAVRDQAASDNGIDTFLMSSHAASRPACAPIQGKTVTTRLEGFNAEGEWFEPLDNHGYGEPGGTFGINCSHIKWAYIPGVNTNNQEQFDPQESVEKYKWQQKQRALERKVRESKRNEDLADQLGDDVGRRKYGLDKRKYQSALRKLVDDHDFLARDYSREQVYSSKITQSEPVKQVPNKTEFKSSVKDSDIINAFEKTNVKEAFGDEYYKQFKSSISSLKDEQLRKLYANYGQDLEFANVSKIGDDKASTNTVHLSNSAFEGSDISEPMEVVFHEIGHAIDSTAMNDVFGKQSIPTGGQIKQRFAGKTYTFDELSSHVSGDPSINLGTAIKQDLFDYINHGEAKSPMQMGKKPRKEAEKAIWLEEDSKSWEGVEKIRQFIRDTKPAALENLKKYSNVSDMIEGTGYDVSAYPWNTGHGLKYWKYYGHEETEFFAEYTSARVANPASLALIKEIFPNAAKICDSLIDTMVEAKK